MKVALITGASGQDGSYLRELLTEKGYDIKHLVGDIVNFPNVHNLIIECIPYEQIEIYNLAAKIHEGGSTRTFEVNSMGILNILESVKQLNLSDKCRIFQASSSEMFGKIQEYPQNEQTVFHPRTTYGVSKVAGHWLVRQYRESHNMYICSGILYNHESPRRADIYVTQKIIKGLQSDACLHLGNLDSVRDWGHAKDYVEAMWLMLQQDEPGDYIISTGKTHSIREFVEMTLKVLGKTVGWEGTGVEEVGIIDDKIGIRISKQFYRPDADTILVGDPSKLEGIGWSRKYDLNGIIEEMLSHPIEK
tara:strand:- start:2027 stop:2941 length:915 start_codon:yes stop_codon:yes gene_type:complete